MVLRWLKLPIGRTLVLVIQANVTSQKALATPSQKPQLLSLTLVLLAFQGHDYQGMTI